MDLKRIGSEVENSKNIHSYKLNESTDDANTGEAKLVSPTKAKNF